MTKFRGSYVHRGDSIRRRSQVQRALLLAGFVASLGAAAATGHLDEANAEGTDAERDIPFYLSGDKRRIMEELSTAEGELALATAQLARANAIIGFSSEWGIGADLARDIYDIALAEGIEPGLAFRLVRVESEFNEQARSPVGAVGLTQLMPATAAWFQKGVTREQLYDRETNLRIGFRYLRGLIGEYDGDVRLALLVYNRGPVAVNRSLRSGLDPANGYAKLVMNGYEGRGYLE
ncbi:MAG: lytic transglycosylase domain-containing protein [Gemmatimonadaceae bacterium]